LEDIFLVDYLVNNQARTFFNLEIKNKKMSFYLKIKTENRISYQELISNLKQNDVKIIQPNKLGDLINDESCKLYIINESTRGVTLKFLNSEYSIGINVISSETDIELALSITEAISILTNSLILPEDREKPIDTITFKNEFDKSWIDREKLIGIGMFIDKIGNDGDILAIGCCNLTYLVGPKVHSQLNKNSELEYYYSLVTKIKNAQFFDRQKFVIPNIIQITSRDNGEVKRIIVLYQNGNQFLPKSEFLVINSDNERIELPFNRINEIATDKFTLMDEEQYFVDTLTDNEFRSLLIAAKTAILKPVQDIQTKVNSDHEPKNRWWKFW
jgi:hypothetical protein